MEYLFLVIWKLLETRQTTFILIVKIIRDASIIRPPIVLIVE